MKNSDFNTPGMPGQFEISVPESVHTRIEETLASLPEKTVEAKFLSDTKKTYISGQFMRTFSAAAACFFLVFTLVLPNVSAVYANAVSDIPLLGSLVRVFTIRNYTESDEKHEISINVPAIDSDNTAQTSEINDDIAALTETVLERFRSELGSGTGSLHIDYETVTNTEDWFTLKLSVSETSVSGYNYSKYCHIDRKNESPVKFGDLFGEDGMAGIAEIILGKMKAEMAADSEMIYWVEDITVDTEMIMQADENTDRGILIDIPDTSENKPHSEITAVPVPDEKIPCVTPDQNFYFREDGSLVIVYNEYTVAPGSMGCPEILLTQAEYTPYLKTSN